MMKRSLSMMLVIVMMLSFSITAFADETGNVGPKSNEELILEIEQALDEEIKETKEELKEQRIKMLNFIEKVLVSDLDLEKQDELIELLDIKLILIGSKLGEFETQEERSLRLLIDKIRLLKRELNDDNLLSKRAEVELITTEVKESQLPEEEKASELEFLNTLLEEIEVQEKDFVKKTFNERLKEIKEGNKDNYIVLLKALKLDVSSSILDEKDKEVINAKIDLLIKEYEDSNLETINLEDIKSKIKIEASKDKLEIVFPNKEGYKYEYNVSSEGKKVVDGIANGRITLPNVTKATNYELKFDVVSNSTGESFGKAVKQLSFNDTEKPSLGYAYVKDGYLYVSYEDNYSLPKEAFGYKFGKRDRVTYTSKDNVKVNVPEEITIIIKDSFGNKLEKDFDIRRENEVLFGEVPEDVEKDMVEGRITKFKYFDNVVLVDRDKVVNIIDTFEELFEDVYERSFDERDLIFKGSKVDRYNEFKERREGVYTIDVSHERFKEELTLYIYVQDRQSSEIRDIRIDRNFKTSSEKFNLEDILDIEWYRNTKDRDMQTDYLFFKEYREDQAFHISEDIVLNKNYVNKIEILDALSGDVYNIEIEHDKDAKEVEVDKKEKDKKEEEKDKTVDSTNKIDLELGDIKVQTSYLKYFTDVEKSHWASNSITKATSIGVFYGYPDRSFKPENDMTVREFFSMYGRFLTMVPEESKNKNSSVRYEIEGDQWGIAELIDVVGRIPGKNLSKFNISDIERKITREEVAFLIANTVDTDTKVGKDLYEDISESLYKDEINSLTQNKVLNGYPNGEFKPKDKITRAEIAQIIASLF